MEGAEESRIVPYGARRSERRPVCACLPAGRCSAQAGNPATRGTDDGGSGGGWRLALQGPGDYHIPVLWKAV